MGVQLTTMSQRRRASSASGWSAALARKRDALGLAAGDGGGDVVSEATGADGGAVDDGDAVDAAPDQRPGDGRGAAPPGSPDHDVGASGVEAGIFEGGLEAGDVGVVAGEAPAFVDDGVDGADEARGLMQAVDGTQGGLFVGDGDVRAERVGPAQARR